MLDALSMLQTLTGNAPGTSATVPELWPGADLQLVLCGL